jgi:hypothetical protein
MKNKTGKNLNIDKSSLIEAGVTALIDGAVQLFGKYFDSKNSSSDNYKKMFEDQFMFNKETSEVIKNISQDLEKTRKNNFYLSVIVGVLFIGVTILFLYVFGK